MFKNLLVPLDGSHLAETALPPAAVLAQELHASVILIHVIERNAPKEIHGDQHLTNEGEACNYLETIAAQTFPESVQVEKHVHSEEVRNVARSIVDHASEYDPDLILLTTHGEGGLRDWVVGSIAQQVITLGQTPVLLLRPSDRPALSPPTFHRFLVALDGNPAHEAGLSVAAGLAEKTQASLILLNVVSTMRTLSGQQAAAGMLLPGTTAAMLEMKVQAAAEYLEGQAAPWRAAGRTVSCRVRRGEPAPEIAKAAEENDCDLIVVGTHGKAGLDAFWAGSVGAKISPLTAIPLLLVPVEKAG